ncbi:MAG TPA: hypothetical protein VGQ83_05170 [Polyangia bacterium]|jgi:hypothetical protein
MVTEPPIATRPPAGVPQSRVAPLIDAVVARYASDPHVEETIRAREEWLERAGRVFDDEAAYEGRVATFHEWYALTRPLEGGPPPVERYLVEEAQQLPETDRECLRALCRAQWSLWEVLETAGTQLRLFDLWGGGRFEVLMERDLPGLERGDLFEARLIGLGGEVRFTRAFLFHPREAVPAIERHVELAHRRGDDREAVIFRLAQVRLRCDRYRNIAPRRIYEQTLSRHDRSGSGT